MRRGYVCGVPVEVQSRDREIMGALWRFDFLTTSQVASMWWEDRDVSRARDRLAQLATAGLLARNRPLARLGTREWIYRLAPAGFRELQRDGLAVTEDPRWSERRVQMRRVDHVLRVNDWLIAYAGLVDHRMADWRGPREARSVAAGTPASDEPAPTLVSPDAAAVLRIGNGAAITLLVELTRPERPIRLAERLRHHASLVGLSPRLAGEPVRGTIFVAPTLAAVEQLVRMADRELAIPDEIAAVPTARERIVFCARSDVRRGSRRAWLLPAQPPERRASPDLTALEVSLPG
jgi:hypothetical protein